MITPRKYKNEKDGTFVGNYHTHGETGLINEIDMHNACLSANGESCKINEEIDKYWEFKNMIIGKYLKTNIAYTPFLCFYNNG